MAATNSSSKSARLQARVSPEQKELIERAAAYTGRTVSDFVVSTLEQAAMKIVDQYKRVPLNQTQSRTLVKLLLSPQKPNRKLKLAVKEYRQRVESR